MYQEMGRLTDLGLFRPIGHRTEAVATATDTAYADVTRMVNWMIRNRDVTTLTSDTLTSFPFNLNVHFQSCISEIVTIATYLPTFGDRELETWMWMDYFFVKIDRIDSIRRNAALVEELVFYCSVFCPVETVGGVVSARKCRDFLVLLPGNAEYQKYLSERTATKKAELDELMEHFKNENIWKMFDVVIAFTLPFKEAHLACSRKDMPLSDYPLLVQALRNDINKCLTLKNLRSFLVR